jgi:hypothetical protein
MWPRRQEILSPPDASPPRCAQLMGLASRGCLALRAGRHSREEETSLPIRPWSAVDPYPRSTPCPGKPNSKMRWAERSTASRRPSPIPFAHTFSRINNVDAIVRHRRADRGASGPFHVEDDPGHQGPHRRRPGRAAPNTPGAGAGGVLHQKERSQPTPVAVARCGNRRVGGGCCASSRPIP